MIRASAPLRICDNGGWTDTWFGGPGRVLNIAVDPGVEVSIRRAEGPDPVMLAIDASGDWYPIVPGERRHSRNALLEAAIDTLPPPEGRFVEITVSSAVPAGCGTGTSAAVAVALLGGLAATRSERPSAHEIASAAHRLEVVVLGLESGVQDQLSSAYGGINFIEIESYPEATVQRLPAWEELSELLTLVVCGGSHDSPALHARVIAEGGGSAVFSRLRAAAVAARDAVVLRDLDAFGKAMIANTDAQRALHPEVVGADALRVIETAASQGAIGWKVNGAGGEGGSVSILSPTRAVKKTVEDLVNVSEKDEVIPVRISAAGLQVRGAL